MKAYYKEIKIYLLIIFLKIYREIVFEIFHN